jgi:multimeric flavodoxin WrbA
MHMKTRQWLDAPSQKLEALCAFFPPIIRDRWVRRLVYNSEKIAAYESVTAVTEDIFWRAVYEVFPWGYEPLILRIKDMPRLQADVAASRTQEDLPPGSEPVHLLRWGSDAHAAGPVAPGRNILAVCASPRAGGNTDVVLDELLRACADGGATVEKIYLKDMDIRPCTGCRACRKVDVRTICTVQDDMTRHMYAKIYAADGLLLGFPIYTARENGIMANFMDRWDCFANPLLTRKMPAGKQGLVVCAWMWPHDAAYDNVVEQMVVLLRLHGVTTTDVITVSGTRGKNHGRGVVKNHPDLLATAYRAGVDFLAGLGRP